jgi:hypothetical protein
MLAISAADKSFAPATVTRWQLPHPVRAFWKAFLLTQSSTGATIAAAILAQNYIFVPHSDRPAAERYVALTRLRCGRTFAKSLLFRGPQCA